MKMLSTRGIAPAASISDAIAAGLAADGGLYMPESLPTFNATDFDGDTSLAQVACSVLELGGGNLAAPAGFQRALEFAFGADAREAQVGNSGHVNVSSCGFG